MWSKLAEILLVLLLAAPALAQTVSGTILGTVTDPTGAAVPGARITVTNEGTNARYDTLTNETGSYRVPFLPVVTYSVKAESAGFQTVLRQGVILRVDESVRVDVALQVGRVAEQVTITGAAPLLNTENASTGQVIENERIVNLPLNGRNFLQLAQLTAEVNAGAAGTLNKIERLTPAQKGVSLAGAGQRDVNTTFLVDGANVRGGYLGSVTIVPSVDSIQEFQMQTSAFTAQFGTSPVHLNVAIKSGTNALYGSLYEFHREAFLNARNALATSKLPYHQHAFGGTIGGPLVRDRTFYFFSYEGRRIKIKSPSLPSFPPQALRDGDFSSLLPGTIVRDPLTGQPFSGNVIPAGRIVAQAKVILPYWPLPTRPGLTRNYDGYSPLDTDNNDYIGRVDHSLGSNDKLYGRYGFTDPFVLAATAGVGGNNNFLSINSQNGQNLLVGETHTFSPRVFNEFRFAFNRSTYLVGPQRREDLASKLQWGGIARTIGMPIVNVSGFGILADMPAGGYIQQVYQFSDNLFVYRGRHSLSAGLDIFRNMTDPTILEGFQLPAPRATATFLGTYTGNPFADFLLGIPYSGHETINKAGYLSPPMSLRYPDFNFYFQDDWKVSRRLTINLGLRYELVPVISSSEGAMRSFDFRTGQLYPNPGTRMEFYRGSHKNFAPRLGFAWQPWSGAKTVIRSGYGWYYARTVTLGPPGLASNPPANRVRSFQNLPLTQPGPPAVTMATFLSNTDPSVVAGGGVSAIDPYYTQTPSTQIWSFDIQHQLPAGMLVDVGYKGSITTHLDGTANMNTAPPGPGAVNPRRPYPAWGAINTHTSVFTATYHAAIVKVEKRMSAGLSLLASYAFSKTLDQTYGPAGDPGETGGVLSPQDRTNFRAEKGRSGLHQKNRAVFSYVYQLPFGPGKRFLHYGGVAGKIVGGWSLTGITTFQNGGPLTVRTQLDVSNSGTAFQRPDLIGQPNLPSGQRRLDRWFNTAAFANPTTIRYGNAGRSLIDKAGVNNFDLALMKDTAVRERVRLQFRAEFFNAFNHPMWGSPTFELGDARFGTIASAADPRLIQLGLKLLW